MVLRYLFRREYCHRGVWKVLRRQKHVFFAEHDPLHVHPKITM